MAQSPTLVAAMIRKFVVFYTGGKGRGGWGKCARFIGLTTLSPSCVVCLEIWEPQPPGTLRACPGLKWNCFLFCQ